MTRRGKRSRQSRYRKRRVKPFWAELKSAAGKVGSTVSSGVRGAAEKAAPYVGAGLVVAGTAAATLLASRAGKGGEVGRAQSRTCPPGYNIGPGNRCYLTSAIPRGPAPPRPDIKLTTPGTLGVPSQESFGSSLKSAAPAVLRGQGRVNADKMRIEGITFTAKHRAKRKQQMGMVGGVPGAGGAPIIGVDQEPGLRMSLSSGYMQMEEDRKRRVGRMRARKKGMLDRAMEMGGYYYS